MKIVRTVTLDEYVKSGLYNYIEDNIYQKIENGKHYITLYCILENDENDQYPLEDLLDEYHIIYTNYFINTYDEQGNNVLIFEIESALNENKLQDFAIIKKVRALVGKSVNLKNIDNCYKLIVQ